MVSDAPIPPGYTYVIGLGCIIYDDDFRTYQDARTHCQNEGGDLLDVDLSPTVGLLLENFIR